MIPHPFCDIIESERYHTLKVQKTFSFAVYHRIVSTSAMISWLDVRLRCSQNESGGQSGHHEMGKFIESESAEMCAIVGGYGTADTSKTC